MSTTISMGDAAVALRSLPRRYREIVAGPVGDDAWDRSEERRVGKECA